MGLDYPWSILGIESTFDEKAIRRAYAGKLKVTRPDEDAAAFQALVEARDVALHQSRFLSRHEEAASPHPEDRREIEAVSAVSEDMASDVRREPPLLVEVPAPERELIETATDRSAEDVGYIDASELLRSSPVGDEEREPDVEELLDEVGKSHPWRGLKAQWADVFDALERTSLTDYPDALWQVLTKLDHDLSRDVGELPDVSTWDVDPSIDGERLLGRYRDILRDFESRFGFLHQDRVVFDYLDDDDAHHFINALTIAVGRTRAERPPHAREINVENVNPAYVHAAWASDDKMRAYYQAAREKDSFPTAFSWLALLFPLPFALYHHLYGVAALAAILSGANTAVQIIRSRGGDVGVGNMALTVYVITAFAFAFNWRRIRLHALGQQAKKLTAKGLGSSEIEDRLRIWGRPSPSGMWLGVTALVLASAARAYFR